MRRCWRLAGESIIYTASDGSPYEKRVDAKGRVLSDECIADEVPFELPEGWCWARLKTVFEMRAGKGIKASEISDVPTEDMPYPCFGGNGIRGYVSKPNVVGDYPLIGRQGALCGNINRATGEFYATEHAVAARCFAGISVDWACIFLEALNLNQYATATAQPGLAVSKIAMVLLPLPPLAEQRRIAERVSELMPLVEAYGELEDARERLDAALPGRLRRSVLREAVRGRLVSQDPSDEAASELLGRIRAERRELAAEGKARLPKGGDSVIFTGSDGRRYEKRVNAKGRESEPACIEDEIPFEIPEGWAWARLGTVVYQRQQIKPAQRFSYIDISSIDNDRQELSHRETVLEPSEAPSRARRPVQVGDVLYSTVRPYLHNMCIIDREFSFPPIASTGFAAMVCHSGLLNRYLLHFLLSPDFDVYANRAENSKGVTYPAINDKRLYAALVPIPSLCEQKRIVSKCNLLLRVIN